MKSGKTGKGVKGNGYKYIPGDHLRQTSLQHYFKSPNLFLSHISFFSFTPTTQVEALPTLILFYKGEVVERFVGYRSADDLEKEVRVVSDCIFKCPSPPFHTHTHTHTHTYTDIHTHRHTHIHTHTHTCIDTHTYTNRHTHVHTHIHTHIYLLLLF